MNSLLLYQISVASVGALFLFYGMDVRRKAGAAQCRRARLATVDEALFIPNPGGQSDAWL